MLVQFTGAAYSLDEIGDKVWHERGPVWVNPRMVSAVYDHTIMLPGYKINVMEDLEQIRAKIRAYRPGFLRRRE